MKWGIKMIDMDKVHKWSREALEKRLSEMDSYIVQLNREVDELGKQNSFFVSLRDGDLVKIKKITDQLDKEKQRNVELTNTVLALSCLLAEIRSHI